MKLREEKALDDSVMVGAEESANFSITASGKAFKILMSGIYSNPQGAAVREIMTNALDAQVEAGTAHLPFHVHVPSGFNPTFSVRDFGISMPREKVMQLYSSLFASSKTESNDVTGAFGIGSKAPFAIVDSFQVVTFLDGVKTAYQCQMHEAGVPKIHVVGSRETSEPNGVEVSLAVKSQDIDAVRKEIRKMLLGFDVMPELLNVDMDNDVFFNKAASIRETQSGKTWRIYGNDFNEAFGDSGLYARQGCVVYHIDLSQIEDAAREAGKMDILSLFRSNSWSRADTTAILDFPIGQLSVAASREALSYDEETINAIVSVLDVLADELVADGCTLINAEDTPLKAARVFSGLELGHGFKKLIGKRVEIEIEVFDHKTNTKILSRVPIEEVVSKYRHGLRFSADKLQAEYGLLFAPVRATHARPTFRSTYQIAVDIWNGAEFILDDGSLDKAANRMITYLKDVDDKNRQRWWVRPADDSMSKAEQQANLKRFLDSMQADLTYDLLEDYDPTNLGSGRASTRTSYSAFRVVDIFARSAATRLTHKPEDGGLYVLLTKGNVKFTTPGGDVCELAMDTFSYVVKLVNGVIGRDILNGRQLIGIIGNSHSLVEKHAGWVSFVDELKAAMANEINKGELDASAKAWACDTFTGFGSEGHKLDLVIRLAAELKNLVGDEHLLSRLTTKRDRALKPPRYKQSSISFLTSYFDLDVPQYQVHRAEYISLAKQACEVYPLLISVGQTQIMKDAIHQYITLIDQDNAARVDAFEKGEAA